jgi:hypothetical protein
MKHSLACNVRFGYCTCKVRIQEAQPSGKSVSLGGVLTLECQVCNKEFQAGRKSAKYCSEMCKKRAYRDRQLSTLTASKTVPLYPD